jgi:hypothetical protein
MEVDDLTGRLTTDENRALLADLALFPLLQHQLRLLIHSLRRSQTADKIVGLATKNCALFQLYNISIVYKKQQTDRPHKSIQTPASYGTQQQDGITLPRRETFLNAYKVLSLSMLPSKTKE